MAALFLLKRSLSRLSPGISGQVLRCQYHTQRGVYGYRPKQSDRDQQAERQRIAARYQGQYWVNNDV